MIYPYPECRRAFVPIGRFRDLARYVQEFPPVATHPDPVAPLPPLSAEQAAALETVRASLSQARTQVASCLLGCPPLTRETATLAEISTQMVRGAALYEGLLELADERRRLSELAMGNVTRRPK